MNGTAEQIKITNTNRSRSGSKNSMVTAYDDRGKIIARVVINKHNPLKYLMSYNGKYRKSWIDQFAGAGYAESDALRAIGL